MIKFNQHPEQKAINAKLHELFEKYVPTSGSCETVGGEIVRAMNRILYRFYNDGDMCKVGYGRETVNPACRYLVEGQGLTLRVWESWTAREDYDYQLYEDLKNILGHLDRHPELFTTPNSEDMWDYQDPVEDTDCDPEDWEED